MPDPSVGESLPSSGATHGYESIGRTSSSLRRWSVAASFATLCLRLNPRTSDDRATAKPTGRTWRSSAFSQESNSCRSATASDAKVARPLRHREHLGLAGEDLLGEHAMDLVIGVRAGVAQYRELVVAVSRFSQSR